MRTSEIQTTAQDVYVVQLYEDNQLVQSRRLEGKSQADAEIIAENWESGVIKLLTE
jgi:hypothetical protein